MIDENCMSSYKLLQSRPDTIPSGNENKHVDTYHRDAFHQCKAKYLRRREACDRALFNGNAVKVVVKKHYQQHCGDPHQIHICIACFHICFRDDCVSFLGYQEPAPWFACLYSMGLCAVTCGRYFLQNGTMAKYEHAMHVQNTTTDMQGGIVWARFLSTFF